MSTATSAPKRSVLAWIGLLFLLMFFGLLWSLFGPDPPLLISKQTTYITAPLDANGLPDYEQYWLQRQDRNLPEADNAAVVLLQMMGLGLGKYPTINRREWQYYQQQFGDLAPPAGMERIGIFENPVLSKELHEWAATNRGKRLKQYYEDLDFAAEVVDIAVGRTWSATELPPLADWFADHEAELMYLMQGSGRRGFHCPDIRLADSSYDPVLRSLPGVFWHYEDLQNIGLAYSNLKLGSREYSAAAAAIRAHFNWVQHFNRGAFVRDNIVSTDMLLQGYRAIQRFAAEPEAPTALLTELTQIVSNTPVRIGMGRAFGQGERLASLGSILHPEHMSAHLSEFADENEPERDLLLRTRIDVNITLAVINDWYNRLEKASSIRSYPQRQAAIDQIESETPSANDLDQFKRLLQGAWGVNSRSELLAKVYIGYVKWWLSANFAREDALTAERQITLMSLALAIHRSTHQEFPAALADLQPPPPPTMLVDTYHGKPLVYRRTGQGFLLYTVGANGIDEGGDCNNNAPGIEVDRIGGDIVPWEAHAAENGLVAPGADDISLRFPIKPLPWPWETKLEVGEESGDSMAE